MALITILIITLHIHVLTVAPQSEIGDEIELLKCEIKDLGGSYNELKEENEKQKVEINNLKTSNLQQKYSLMQVQKQSSKLSTYCSLLPAEVCGPCTCLNDFELDNKYFCDCQHLKPMRDCLEFYNAGNNISGLYKITMNNLKLTQVYCDQQTDNGGWSVIQRRFNGKTNFYRNWNSYKMGFGDSHREFWLGNDDIYLLTLQSEYPKGSELRIDMTDWSVEKIYAKYDTFKVDNEKKNYTLHVGGYSGDAGDSLIGSHNGQQFSTYDEDNDGYTAGSCSTAHRGAWWYGYCHTSNLNGEYRLYGEKQPGYARGVIWYTHGGYENSMKFVEMKVRRKV